MPMGRNALPQEKPNPLKSSEKHSEKTSMRTSPRVSSEPLAEEIHAQDSQVEESASQDQENEIPSGPTFRDLMLPDDICSALESAGYHTPTDIQAATIPAMLEGRDVLGQAQTGTGKTAAFALPLLANIDVENPETQVLVLAPTRELANQVSESFLKYGQHLRGLRVAPIYGGAPYANQIHALKRGAHVVVGTPGRIMDHMRESRLRIDSLKTMVLDEADEMLRMGFVDDVQWILDQCPSDKQIALFSATMPDQIRQIANKHLKTPKVIKITSRQQTGDNIRQRFLVVEPRMKLEALTRIIEAEDFDGMIIFVKTKLGTVEVADYLREHGYAAVPLNGDDVQGFAAGVTHRPGGGAGAGPAVAQGEVAVVVEAQMGPWGAHSHPIRTPVVGGQFGIQVQACASATGASIGDGASCHAGLHGRSRGERSHDNLCG
jgi:superfamily II DNA/RNA helicase